MTAPDPLSTLATAAEGDVAAARACACQLLAGAGSKGAARDARLLLTAVCLHLHTQNAAELTTSDLAGFLGGQGLQDVLAILRDNPLSVVDYAVIELSALTTTQQSSAVSVTLAAVERFKPCNVIKLRDAVKS